VKPKFNDYGNETKDYAVGINKLMINRNDRVDINKQRNNRNIKKGSEL
jgi:hypothetical protein